MLESIHDKILVRHVQLKVKHTGMSQQRTITVYKITVLELIIV